MLVGGEVRLHLQPIYFRDGRMGYEVLSRGKNGTGAGSIIKEMLKKHSCGEFDLMIMQKAMLETSMRIYLAVNVFPGSLVEEGFIEKLDDIVARSFRERSTISIEINEAANYSDARVVRNIERFKSLGYKISLDDYDGKIRTCEELMDIGPNSVKFDKALVGDASVAKSIEYLNRRGIDTIIEGVETRKELKFARKLGYSGVQGYYIGIPTPVQEESAMNTFGSAGLMGMRYKDWG